MPCGVMMAGGPASTSQASKYPRRGVSTFTSFPAESASGVQSTRLSDVAMRMSGTSKYIQYLPFTAVAMRRLPAMRATMAPDFDSRLRYFPPSLLANAGPCFRQWMRSRDVAIARDRKSTSELQSPVHLVCRLLLEKKNKQHTCK